MISDSVATTLLDRVFPHRRSTVVHAAAAMTLLTATAASAADWPQRRGPANNGISEETRWSHQWGAEGPRVQWKGSVGTGFAAVTVANDLAYTAGNRDDEESVVCLHARTGKPVWKFTYPEPLNPKMYEGGPNSTPTVHAQNVLVMSRTGKLFCLQAATGGVVWTNALAEYVGRKNGDWGAAGSPLVVGDRVIVNYGSAMVAVDLATGQPQWQSAQDPKGKYSFTSAVLSPGTDGGILFAHMHKALFALAPADGRVLWQHPFGSGYETHSTDPILTPGGVFISSGDDGGELIQYTRTDSTRRWKNKNLGTFTGTAVLIGQHLYAVDAGGYGKGRQELRCVDLEKGEVKWSLPGFGQDSLLGAGDRLILLTERGELIVARATPERGEILARAQVLGGKSWTQPTLAHGFLYCRNAAGQIVCLNLNAPGA